jgi:hypothetical protein
VALVLTLQPLAAAAAAARREAATARFREAAARRAAEAAEGARAKREAEESARGWRRAAAEQAEREKVGSTGLAKPCSLARVLGPDCALTENPSPKLGP